jgi:DNA invertase Pin-like site-specific DNA recombinase
MQYVAYYRVSTQKQGKSGLGLEAQRHTLKSFLKPGDKLLAEFTEVESGKKAERVELQHAIDAAKQHKATLLIAKLDRLARNVSFIFALRDSGVEFQCCDIPEANTLTIGLFAVLAQHERELISKRTCEALQAKKAQGFKLGSPKGFVGDVQKQGPPARKKRAAEHLTNRQLAELVRLYRTQQHSYEVIAQKLNASGYRTRQGQAFAPMSVWRLARLNAEPIAPTLPSAPVTPTLQTTTVHLWLRVENNNKFVRGKKRAREDIEFYCLRRQGMKKLSEWEYELTFTYRDAADLDQQVYDLLNDMEQQADLRNCFTEADAREQGTERYW